MLENLSKQELLDLVICYDKYIQNANDENWYVNGWCPVCIEEFYQSDMEYYK